MGSLAAGETAAASLGGEELCGVLPWCDMKVEGIDERNLLHDGPGGNFVVFIYEGGNEHTSSWSVDSYLFTDAGLPDVLRWLSDNLPMECCWSLGVVTTPEWPTPETEVDVSWVVGADVLNTDPRHRTEDEQRLAVEMLARRHRVALI